MNDIQTIAIGADDYPFGTYYDDSNAAYRRLTSAGFTRLQIQHSIVRELERLDVQAWNEYQTAIERFNAGEIGWEATDQAQAKTYRIRERLGYCTQELRRQIKRTQ